MDNNPRYFDINGHDQTDYSGKHLSDAGGKKLKFQNCVFSYGILQRCYFHEAVFEKCKFIGTRFIGCNFRSARFIDCEFQYSTFAECILPLDTVLQNLPYPPNQRRDMLRSLRVNAVSVGDYEGENNLISRELRASRDHHKNVFTNSNTYYRKYTLWDRVKSFLSYVALVAEDLAWGYGMSPLRLLLLTLIITALFGYGLADDYPKSGEHFVVSDALIFGVKQSILGLLDFSLVTKSLLEAHSLIFAIIAALRFVLIGLFVTVIYRRYARR